MVMKRSFGGSSLRKPGAYSRSSVSPNAGSPLETNDTILIVGEADAGAPGASEGIQFFSISALSQLVSKYRTGPIVDAAKNMASPSRTQGVSGAGRIGVWKTNDSEAASLDLEDSYGSLDSQEYGVGGNRLTEKVELADEVNPELEGSAPITNFAGLDTLTLMVRKNGGASETVTFAAPANISDVLSQINAGTTGLVASATGAVLKLTQDARTNGHRDGWGQSLEISGGSALGLLFLTDGQFASSESEFEATLTTSQPRDSKIESLTVGGEIVLQVGRDDSDSCTAATIEIDEDSIELVATGSDSYSLSKSDYPLLKNVRDAINALPGWSCSISSVWSNMPSEDLDQVSPIGAFSPDGNKPARIKRDAASVADFFGDSSLVDFEQEAEKGLPDALGQTNFSGGTQGSSSSSDFDAGFSAALSQKLKGIVPLVSQDASQDILDGDTDAASTYDIETIHAALDTQLRLRGNIKNRKESQGFVGYRKQAKADVFAQSAGLSSELIQLFMEDVLVVDSSNELTWKKPHILAAMFAAMRAGSDIGEPMTHKFISAQGVGHYVNSSTGQVEGDYDPLIDYDAAIDAGVTSMEPDSGSFQVMVDNTTYGQDASFVFNRGSVVEASQYAAQTVRDDAEKAFVGKKNAIIDASAIKSRIRTKLRELFIAKILSPSEDAPEGFREDTFIVNVTGNTAEVEVEIKPVQGLDFILISFTLGETKQSA